MELLLLLYILANVAHSNTDFITTKNLSKIAFLFFYNRQTKGGSRHIIDIYKTLIHVPISRQV